MTALFARSEFFKTLLSTLGRKQLVADLLVICNIVALGVCATGAMFGAGMLAFGFTGEIRYGGFVILIAFAVTAVNPIRSMRGHW